MMGLPPNVIAFWSPIEKLNVLVNVFCRNTNQIALAYHDTSTSILAMTFAMLLVSPLVYSLD